MRGRPANPPEIQAFKASTADRPAPRYSARMSPYMTRIVGLLGDRDPVEVIAETPGRLAALAPRLAPDLSYGPGKWTAREIVCHLADVELAEGFRLRQVLAGAPEMQPFDQDRWVERYAGLGLDLALAAFTQARAWDLALIRGLDAHDLALSAHHPERGQVSVSLMLRFRAGHDLNHLAQLETIAGQTPG